MSKLPNYYSAPVAEERLRPLAETLAGASGCSYERALDGVRAAIGQKARAVPRYMIARDRSVVRLWGSALIHNGRKAQ